MQFHRRRTLSALLLLGFGVPAVLGGSAQAQQPPPAPADAVIFNNVRIFDGKPNSGLTGRRNVLILGNKIEDISRGPVFAPPGSVVQTIEGGGRTLMPGLIDAHIHTMLQALSPSDIIIKPPPPSIEDQTKAIIAKVATVAAAEADRQLMRGFTTVRDVGGPAFGLKQAIDGGKIRGPRIFPSGAMISQTSGHGDFRPLEPVTTHPNDPLPLMSVAGVAVIADGVDQVHLRTREQLRQGASQIKLMAGGGVASAYDPLDAAQYTEAELRAAVLDAENWGTYVTVHAYTDKAIITALNAGVKCIEHGQLMMKESTARRLARDKVWLSLQPFFADQDANEYTDPKLIAKLKQVTDGTVNAYNMAKEHGVKMGFGTDTLFDGTGKLNNRQGAQLAKIAKFPGLSFTPSEVLAMATSSNGEMLAMSGLRSPYEGKLGVVEEKALADLILVDGDPTKDIDLIADPANNFSVIMKDGKIYKNLVGKPTAKFRLTSENPSTYDATYTLHNDGASTLSDWRLTATFPPGTTVDTVTGGVVKESDGIDPLGRRLVTFRRGPANSPDLAPGASLTFKFTGQRVQAPKPFDKPFAPESCTLNGQPCLPGEPG